MSTVPSPSPPSVPAPVPTGSAIFTRVIVAAAVGLAAALFAGTFARLVTLWERDANYSHGYLVVAISLVLAYRIARRVGAPVRGELAWGVFSILFGVLCQWVVTVFRWPPLSYLALVCVIRGLLVCAGGRAWAAAFNFPLLFLFFMFPLPATWTSFAAIWLQDVVSRVSETVLSLFVVCHRVGHNIRIAGVDKSLIVAEECSGLGQIVSFVAFAALLGHLLSRPVWYRVTLVAAAVPVAVAANTLRVVLMNLGAVYFGTRWMGGTLHDAPALFSIPVGVALFLLFDRVAGGRFDREGVPPAEPTATPERAEAATARTPVRGVAVAAAVLAAGVLAQVALAAHIREAGEPSYPALTNRLDTLPLAVPDPAGGRGVWAGVELPAQRDGILKQLPYHADDILVRGYRHASGVPVQLYMVYSKAGEDRKHHPEICIRDVSGAPEDLGFRKQVALRPDGSAAAQRFRFLPSVGQATVVYYWHYTLTPAPDPDRTRVQALHQRIGVSAPSVTVQVSLGSDDAGALAAVERQLLPALHAAALTGVLPPATETGCYRVPIGLSRR